MTNTIFTFPNIWEDKLNIDPLIRYPLTIDFQRQIHKGISEVIELYNKSSSPIMPPLPALNGSDGFDWYTNGDKSLGRALNRYYYERYDLSFMQGSQALQSRVNSILSQYGELGRLHSVDFEHNLTKPPDDFYNEDSCWWRSWSPARMYFMYGGGIAMRGWTRHGELISRCLLLPYRTGRGTITGFVLFNSYGISQKNQALMIETFAKQNAGLNLKRVSSDLWKGLETSEMYVNGGSDILYMFHRKPSYIRTRFFLELEEELRERLSSGFPKSAYVENDDVYYTHAYEAEFELTKIDEYHDDDEDDDEPHPASRYIIPIRNEVHSHQFSPIVQIYFDEQVMQHFLNFVFYLSDTKTSRELHHKLLQIASLRRTFNAFIQRVYINHPHKYTWTDCFNEDGTMKPKFVRLFIIMYAYIYEGRIPKVLRKAYMRTSHNEVYGYRNTHRIKILSTPSKTNPPKGG